MNDEVHTATYVTKTHTTNVATFQTPTFGPLGLVSKSEVIYFQRLLKQEYYPIEEVQTGVYLLKAYAGMDGLLLDALCEHDAKGIVIEALGAGNLPPTTLPALQRCLEAGIPIVLVSRAFNGVTYDVYDYLGGGKQLRQSGVIFTTGLSGQKARMKLSVLLSSGKSLEEIEKAFASEQKVNQFQKAIVEYLVEISQQNVSTTDQETIDELFSTANDVERISDHAENIADFAKAVLERDIVLDEKTLSELEHVFDLVQKGFAMSIDTLSTGNLVKVKEVITIEREIDRLKIEIRDKYMKRMNKGIASADSGIFVMDLLSNLERISDHFRNIGETVQRLGRPVVVTE